MTSSTPNTIKRYAIVGCGVRSAHYYTTILTDFPHAATVVALLDTNQTRMNFHNEKIAALNGGGGGGKVPTFKEGEFTRMVEETRPDVVVVLTVDAWHHHYCILAMDHNCDAITEKPMTISAENLQAMIDAEHRTGRQVRVLFNYRYSPHHTKIRELLASNVIGEVSTVHMDWVLDCPHGSDFMRRWHRHKSLSGGIQCHKSIHHFDLINFWLGTSPRTVFAMGSRRYFGAENVERHDPGGKFTRGERYKDNETGKEDPFRIDASKGVMKGLYLEGEHEDGYVRDRNCFGEGVEIEDNVSVMVRYKGGEVLTYNTYAYAPWEGYRVAFNGSKGRMVVDVVEGGYDAHGEPGRDNSEEIGEGVGGELVKPGKESVRIAVYPLWGDGYTVPVERAEGGHGGGDPALMRDVLLGEETEGKDRWERAAYLRAGGDAVLVGVGVNKSMESGLPVEVQELVRWEGSEGLKKV